MSGGSSCIDTLYIGNSSPENITGVGESQKYKEQFVDTILMLGNDKFLASPPQIKEGPRRGVLQDLSNVSASVASWWQSGRVKEKNAKKAKPEKTVDAPDVESPPSKTEVTTSAYMALGDNGVVSPTRSALWNDENAC